ncbi:hypothetical protein B9Z65_3502 [Elsinoe australis]|uniref:Xylanolytic transcriptional activator regulatory domain-containing protein n=1 Tax=Elsinoe australis TaxID=40998 RepID=A0A2P8AFD7_9PEZI|nr:hypothetical protein B9Z65_3502 [Elsinoe australis]
MFHLDRDAYDVSWKRQGLYETPNISRLPSRDYAIYLVNTVKYHLGFFKLFDEGGFIQTLHDFYSGTVEDLEDYRLWYCKLLLVLAFGKGVLNQKKAPREPPGSDYFVRAMANLPEMYALHEEPVLAMEVLTLISLYFYCMDMRQTAYSYIGQALRLALVEGNHTNLNGSQLEPQLAQRCTNNWWIMYILDRTLSSALGTPVSVHDDAIKNVLPEDSSLVLNVKLSRMVSLILSELYNADGSLDDQYLSKVQSLLRQLAKLAEEIGETISIKFPSSMETVPKSAAHVRLMYHQCIILVTRPIMLVLLQKRIRDQSKQVDELPAPVHDLLQTCVQSAIKTLKILTSLSEYNMLDSFLPFDMDFASTAASALVVIKDVMDFDVPMTAKPLIDRILGEMIASGNNAAQLRQQEIDRLHELASNFRQGRPPMRPSVPDVSTHGAAPMDVGPSSSNLSIQTPRSAQQHLPSPRQTVESNTFHDIQPTAFSITPSTDFEHNFALAQDDMLLIADRLDTDAFPGAMDTDVYSGDWLAPTMQFPPL